MNKLFVILASLLFAGASTASESFLVTIYQPLARLNGDAPKAEAVPYVIVSGALPETLFDCITRPHIPQQTSEGMIGDINLASLAGIVVHAESAASGQKKVHVIFDFSKAKQELVTNELIDALVECLVRTASSFKLGDKPVGLYSKFVGAEGFSAIRKRIESRLPMQTMEQLKKDARPDPPDQHHRNDPSRRSPMNPATDAPSLHHPLQ
jgi:hypothetical protein